MRAFVSCRQRTHILVCHSESFSEKPTATKSNLILLTAGQANRSREEVLGQGTVTLFGKPAD